MSTNKYFNRKLNKINHSNANNTSNFNVMSSLATNSSINNQRRHQAHGSGVDSLTKNDQHCVAGAFAGAPTASQTTNKHIEMNSKSSISPERKDGYV